MTRVAVRLLVISVVATAGCGGSAQQSQPFINVTDVNWESPWGDLVSGDTGKAGEDLADEIEWTDVWSWDLAAEVADAAGDGDAAADVLADVEPEVLPGTCMPGVVACEDGSLVVCEASGTSYAFLDDCVDDDPCTEDGCFNGMCVFTRGAGNCCSPPCGLGQVCKGGECVCAPKCLAKDCGDDGCGGLCGICSMGSECLPTGKCSCVPACQDKACGDDGCGGQCGLCAPPWECLDGTCVCVPDCTGKSCGDDGCGGSCGACPALHQCSAGACELYCPTCPDLGGQCPSTPWNGHMYYMCKASKNWWDADKYCSGNKAHLVTVGSQEENLFLVGLCGGNSVWIGYYESWFEWHWVTDEPKAFEAWGEGQPDDGGFWTVEDCTELLAWGAWNDDDCGTKQYYICEHEPFGQ